jgi:cyclopropane fatty-acyl-phospholipid synthase-like methyltransferase
MVTDLHSNYSSPAGREFTLAAGRFAGINPASRVLDMGCGYGAGAHNLAAEFRCKVTAVDLNEENIAMARAGAVDRGVSHLIQFVTGDVLTLDFSKNPFDCIVAEGGVFSFVSRRKGLSLAGAWLQPRGWLAFSDLIFLSDKVPEEVKRIFEDERFHYESEAAYRSMVAEAGFDIQLASLVPQSGWDNYYAHMARRLEDDKGFFADKRIKLAFHREIDVFYRLEGFRYVGYLFCVARKSR